MDSTLDGARQNRPPRRPDLPIQTWIQAASRHILAARGDFPRWCRWATHLTIAGLGVAAVVASRSPGAPGQPVKGPALDSRTAVHATTLMRQASARGGGYLVRAAVPRTTAGLPAQAAATPASERASQATAPPTAEPDGIRTYTVQPGDTVFGLAQRFGLTPESILAANPTLAGNPDLLTLGQEIQILPVSGALHVVSKGDTLAGIARQYKVDVEAIIGYKGNNLSEPYTLQIGQKLVIPGGSWSPPPSQAVAVGKAPASVSGQQAASGRFMWPTTGTITQRPWAAHMAVDIGTPTGTPIYAADAGYVVVAGWSTVGYGNYVMIDHGNGFRTLYGHMSVIIAKTGQWVQKGQKIGLVGSTGHSTGPHLHFEIYKGGVLQNPLSYLP